MARTRSSAALYSFRIEASRVSPFAARPRAMISPFIMSSACGIVPWKSVLSAPSSSPKLKRNCRTASSSCRRPAMPRNPWAGASPPP